MKEAVIFIKDGRIAMESSITIFEGKEYLKPQMQHNVLRLNERVKSLERESEVSTKLETLSSTWVNC